LLVDEEAGAFLRDPTGDGREQAIVDDRLGGRDPLGLLLGKRALPAEETRLERPAVVERKNVERSLELEVRHEASVRRPRWRQMSAFVELSDRKSTRLNSSHEWISYAV